MVEAPVVSVLHGYDLGPTNGNLGSVIDTPRRRSTRERRAPKVGLESCGLPQLQATLNIQLESVRETVARLLLRPTFAKRATSSLRFRSGGGVVGLGDTFPEDMMMKTLSAPPLQRSSFGGIAGRTSPSEGSPESTPPASASMRRRRSSNPAERAQLDFRVPSPEDGMDYLECLAALAETIRSLKDKKEEFASDLSAAERERTILSGEIAARGARLDQLGASLQQLAKERDECTERLRSMEDEHAKIVDSSRELLHSVRREHGRLAVETA